MLECDDISDAEIFEVKVSPVASSRHMYSQARKKLALLTSHQVSDQNQTGPHLNPAKLLTASSRRWSRASSAIYHGVRATQLAKISTAAVKRMHVTKPVGREELLHEKFANLLALNDLEERVAVRYGEAKEFTERFRSIRKSLNPKEQVQALDAAQSVLDKLEHVRQTVEVIDDASLQEVDESLAQLAALCDAKSLKSKFHRAGRQAVVFSRLGGVASAEASAPRDNESLRQAFKRAIKKASAAIVLGSSGSLSMEKEGKENRQGSRTRRKILEDDDDLVSPANRILNQLEDSEYNFLTASAEVRATAKNELLMLGVEPGQEPQFERNEAGRGGQEKRQATISASHTLEEGLSWSTSPRGRGASKDRDGSKGASRIDRAALATKKQMVRALMLEMHLRELRGQGPLPALGDGPSSVPVSATHRNEAASKSQTRVKTMPAIPSAGASDRAAQNLQSLDGSIGLWTSPRAGKSQRVSNTPQSWRAEASPFSTMSSVSPHPATISPTMPSSPPLQGGHLKGAVPQLGQEPSGSSLGQRSPYAPRHMNSLEEQSMTPEGIQYGDAQSPGHSGHPQHPQRVAIPAKNFAPINFVDSIRSAMGIPTLANQVSDAATMRFGPGHQDFWGPSLRGPMKTSRSNGKDEAKKVSPKLSAQALSQAIWEQAAKRNTSQSPKASRDISPSHNSHLPKPHRATKGRHQATASGLHSTRSGRKTRETALSSVGAQLSETVEAKASGLDSAPPVSAREAALRNVGGELGESAEDNAYLSQAGKGAFSEGVQDVQDVQEESELSASASPKKSFGKKHGQSYDWRDQQAAVVLEELDALCKAGKAEEAAFGAATFLATVGISPPQLLQWGRRIHSYHEMMQAKKQAQKVLEEAESQLGVTDPALIWEALDQMDSMLSFLEPVCIIEGCFSEEHPPKIEPVRRGTNYDWSAHLKSLRGLKTTLRGSSQWRSLEGQSYADDSLREYISRGDWLYDELEDSDALHEYSCSTTSSLQPRPDRIEWLNDSHQAIIPCRSRHVERKPRRITLEKTVKERHYRGLRPHCVQPEMNDMWEDYCSLVWEEEASPESPGQSLWNSPTSSID